MTFSHLNIFPLKRKKEKQKTPPKTTKEVNKVKPGETNQLYACAGTHKHPRKQSQRPTSDTQVYQRSKHIKKSKNLP